ncbi:MAG: hypothetical protein M1343_08325 [Chloroflexi bacterium]|nr:hypothetical protein [Chloroflexota bacterium]
MGKKQGVVKTKVISDKVTKYGSIGYTVRMREKMYEPGLTSSNINIPHDPTEQRKWLRYFYISDAYFGHLIDFFSEFPQTGTHNTHPDPAIKKAYDELCARIDIDTYLRDIFFDYYLFGDVFPFVYINPSSGEVTETTLLNPDDVVVKRIITSDKEQLYIIPPQELKDVVSSRKPKELYDRLSADQRYYIRNNQPIPLNPMQADHLKRGNSRYSLTGAAPGFRVFRALIQRDKLRDAQWVMADRFTTPIRIFALTGIDGQRPPTNNDVLAFMNMLEMADDDPSQAVVTNFNVNAQLLGTSSQWGHIYQDINSLVDEFLVSFGVNRSLITGGEVTYANAAVGLEALIRQFATAQRLVARVIERLIYEPFAKLQGFVDKDGNPWPADLEWNKLVDDEAKKQELLKGLRSMAPPHISAKTMLNAYGLDSATEAKEIEKERSSVFDANAPRDALPSPDESFDEDLGTGGIPTGEPVDEEAPSEVPVGGIPGEENAEPVPFVQKQQSKRAAKQIAKLAGMLGVDELNEVLEKHGYGLVAL